MANSEDVLEAARNHTRDFTKFDRAFREYNLSEANLIAALAAEVEKLRADLEWSIRRGVPRIRRENMNQIVVGPAEGPLRWIDFDGTEHGLLSAVRRAREGEI